MQAILLKLVNADFVQLSSKNLIFIIKHAMSNPELVENFLLIMDRTETELACRVDELSISEIGLICHTLTEYN